MRALLVAFFRRCLFVFYRRIGVRGAEGIPSCGVVFAVNHPNGLVDPLFVLAFAQRPVAFLAKAPLFRYPFIGWIARSLDCVPVYRKQDEPQNASGGASSPSNAITFSRAREVLARGDGLAIFPEGTTHSDPSLRELKTGAARIALGAASSGGQRIDVVPTGIYYAAKETFRSDALVIFGDPIECASVPLDADGEPDREAVNELTARIERGLDAVTLQAESQTALELVAMAEDIFSAADRPLVESEFALRRQFVEGYHALRARDPERLAALERRIRQFAGALDEAGLEAHELIPRFRWSTLIVTIALLPIALVGAAVHYPAYRLVGTLSRIFARGEDEVRATVKFLAALLLFPLTWIVVSVLAGMRFGFAAGAVALVAAPLSGFIALRTFEKLETNEGRIRALLRPDRARLIAERDAIRQEIIALDEELG